MSYQVPPVRYIPPSPQKNTNPSASKGFAIAAFVVGIVAFLFGWIPLVGVVLGLAAIALAIVAFLKQQPKAFSISGLSLGGVAVLTSITMTFVMILVPSFGTLNPANVADDGSVIGEPEQGQTLTSNDPDMPDISSFRELGDREFAYMLKDLSKHDGERVILYGVIQEYDSTTGDCFVTMAVSNNSQRDRSEYEFLFGMHSGEFLGDECPVIQPLIRGDEIKMWVTISGEFANPEIFYPGLVGIGEIWQAKLLKKVRD